MNEQRKVIYKRRDQILEDADLREETIEALDETPLDSVVGTYRVSEADDEWDLRRLHNEVTGYWPTELTVDDLGRGRLGRRRPHAAPRQRPPPAKRAARGGAHPETCSARSRRQVMLSIIDQLAVSTSGRWTSRAGIGLRATGQRDPPVRVAAAQGRFGDALAR